MSKTGEPSDIWCVIPVYNNGDTVESIARKCRKEVPNVIIVDDGSTDINIEEIFTDEDIEVLVHKKNRGKGAAILTGLEYVKAENGRFMITLDADGQHYPGDIKNFLPLLQTERNDFFVVGSRDFDSSFVPGTSKFGRRFANLWFRIETGKSLDDCQSGFRAYPVEHLSKLNIAGRRYNFETEVLAKLVWGGLEPRTVDIKVRYPEKSENRISHFRTFVDNIRISWTHTKLVTRRLIPVPHRKLVSRKPETGSLDLLFHPVKFIKKLLKEHATPMGLSTSAAVGVFLGALPLIFVHTLVILFVTTRLHLNKIMAVASQNICMPPVVPFLCIETGYFFLNGKWLTEASMDTLVIHLPHRLFEWLLGSLIIGPILGILSWIVTYIIASRLSRGMK